MWRPSDIRVGQTGLNHPHSALEQTQFFSYALQQHGPTVAEILFGLLLPSVLQATSPFVV